MARQKNTEAPAHVLQKRSPLNMKASPELRAKIEEAAQANGLSLTQEVERRLLESFRNEDHLGGRHTAAFIKLLVAIVAAAEARTEKNWTEDFATWWAVKSATDALLSANRPDWGSDDIRAKSEALDREWARTPKNALMAIPNAIAAMAEEIDLEPDTPLAKAHRDLQEALQPGITAQHTGRELGQELIQAFTVRKEQR